MTWLWALVIAGVILGIGLVVSYFWASHQGKKPEDLHIPRQRGESVDLDQDSIPLLDIGDERAKAKYDKLLEKYGAVFVNEELGRTRVEIGSRSWYGRTALDALQKADRELNGA